VEIKAVMTLTF